MDNRIFVLDDERDFLESVRRGLITSGFRDITLEEDPRRAVALLTSEHRFDIALIDITMPGMNGLEVLEAIRSASPDTECIMVTAIDEARMAVDSLRKGAYDYLVKPISKEDLVQSIHRALEHKRLVDLLDLGKRKIAPKLAHPEAFKAIITRSTKVLKVLKEAELHARSDMPVLITGETGTGKELLARAVQAASPRAKAPFTAINMAALDHNLFAAEFFGHVKGAYTGADSERAGYLETSHRGTLFLDEVGSLPLELQGRLLRVLQDGEFIKLGASKPQNIDVRIIAATNADLENLMAKKLFRKDLCYRLRGGWLDLPPLRERREDIPLLVAHFMRQACGPEKLCGIAEESMALLEKYPFPGNVRELKSIIQSAVNLSEGRPITVDSLPRTLTRRQPAHAGNPGPGTQSFPTLEQLEREHIFKAYSLAGGNKSEAARLLGTSLSTLRRKLEFFGGA